MGHLVIGVGGTGFKTLSVLKANLLAASPTNTLPSDVVLRAIDTEPLEQLNNNPIMKQGGVLLDKNEFIYLGQNPPPYGANLMPVGQHLAAEKLPANPSANVEHFTSWFQASTLMRLLPAAAWQINIGAGQQRQIARLALFWNVQNPAISLYHQSMTTAMGTALTGGDLNVLLFGSTVGGTGAGLFVDIAYLVRQLAKNVATSVTAFLVLPEVFAQAAYMTDEHLQQAQARTYACLREMERYSIGLMGHNKGFSIIYNPISPNQIYRGNQTSKKLLDTVYYVDGINGLQPALRDQAPERGTIPLLADVGFALLSDKANSRNTHLANVRGQAVAGGQFIGQPMAGGLNQAALNQLLDDRNSSSGFGAYSLVIPMTKMVDAMSWRLVKEAAEMLAAPALEARRLEANRPGGTAGRSAVDDFCSVNPEQGDHINPTKQNSESQEAPSTPLLQDIRDQGQHYGDGANQTRATQAAKIFHDRRPKGWQPILVLTAHIKGQEFKGAWDAELTKNFVTNDPQLRVLVPVSQANEKAQAAWTRARRRIDEEFTNILGTRSYSGGFSGGSLMGILRLFQPELQRALRERLRVSVLNIMNGSTPTGGNIALIRQYRANSLGYLYDFLAKLHHLLVSYRRAIQDAQTMRNARGGQAERTQKKYDEVSERGDANPAPGFFGRGALRLRQELLDAAQDLLELRRTEQIEEVVLMVAAQFAEEVEALKTEIELWGEKLTTGGQESVSRRAETAQTKAEPQSPETTPGLVRQMIWDPTENERLYLEYAGGGPEKVLSEMTWWVDIQPQAGGKNRLNLQLWQGTNKWQKADQVLKGLHQLAQTQFQLALQRESVLSYLANHNADANWAATAVVQRLLEKSSPALSASAAGFPSIYLIAPNGTNAIEQTYRTGLVNGAQQVLANPNLLIDLPARDPFRITLIQWRDLIGIKNLTSFSTARAQYENYRSRYQYPNPNLPPRLTRETLHTMPGEVQAVGIEARLPTLSVTPRLQPRLLDYEVIQQLEDTTHFKAFVNAWAWEIVTERRYTLENQPIRVLGFDLEEKRDGLIVMRPATEYWLTKGISGNKKPSLLEALWNWNYEWQDKHPDGEDEQNRPRPAGQMGHDTFDELKTMTSAARKQKCQGWLDAHPEWVKQVEPVHQASYHELSENKAQQAKKAALWLAETQYLQEQLRELRTYERKAVEKKEKDIASAMMVMLWESILSANDSWRAELQ